MKQDPKYTKVDKIDGPWDQKPTEDDMFIPVISQCSVCMTGEYKFFGLGTKYCEKHDVCITCGVSRKGLGHTPWGVRDGSFLCQPCEKTQRKNRIKERKAAGFEHRYTNDVVCPHCGYEFSDSWEMKDGDCTCPDCEKDFELQCDYTVKYITNKIEKKNDKSKNR